MREADLPSPGVVRGGQQLRRLAANTISALDVSRSRDDKLYQFFLACSAGVVTNTLTWQGNPLTWQGSPLTWSN